ncbi:CobW family GTP-binding protein [Clostridium manihotivorum]|uniref:Cobalamin biosynthesis protein CobW n=1 Tax=Clostridium manihotivorum TaxID=2320868 RepID=A0A3R5QRF7_9CLOT|nr:CobW family GTP-binding protein [Clostridium manihotivorum]QAA30558.1 cobalamin biosynthesis protein CobW [Clostridium manihotivorum]
MKVKVDLFSGFLGAGKTMLIKKLIGEELKNDKIAIIENEFGEIGIDSSFLKTTKIDVKEINAGCICCSVYGDFTDGIREVIEKYNPERIIIEPSGVAKLSEILSVFKEPTLKDKVTINMIMTVIDVTKYDMYVMNFDEFYKNQIINAKTIILSRTQNVSKDHVVQVVNKIKELNKNANIITTPWDDLNSKDIIEIAEGDAQKQLIAKVNLLKDNSLRVAIKSTTSKSTVDTFKTIGIETPKIYSKSTLEAILTKLNDKNVYGTVLRAKGIIESSSSKWLEFDYVPGEFDIRNSSPDYSGRVCVIGNGLNSTEIKKLFDI